MEQKLSALSLGQTGIIASIVEGSFGSRLQDLGFTPGSRVTAEMASPIGGDPVAYRVRGTLVALRHTDAAQVTVLVPMERTEDAICGKLC